MVRRSVLCLLAVVGAVALCETILRTCPARLTRDVMREFYARRYLRPFGNACLPHRVKTPKPGFHFESRSPNLTLRYTTGSFLVGECRHGFRKNGTGDDRPVFGLALGDSFTQNIRLDDRDGWVSRLSQKTGKRFVNASCGGKGTVYHLAVAQIFIPLLKPRLVILQYAGNDLEDDRVSLGISSGTPAAMSEIVEVQRRNIRSIHRLVRAEGGRLALMFFSSQGWPLLRLDQWCRDNGIPVYIQEESKAHWPDRDFHAYHFLVDGHFNDVGNDLIAEDMAALLSRHGLLSAPEVSVDPPPEAPVQMQGTDTPRVQSVFLFCLKRWGPWSALYSRKTRREAP
ncbi:MAG TPA: SGNH/GDSL hydrolase family protein [Elusimicrobiota bacterium]|nr:SGNH/GDSL hydrolase family protein [Elusimicrobiota bacterium]